MNAATRMAAAIGLLAAAAIPQANAEPEDPNTWPVADNAAYSSPADPGWVFFLPGTGNAARGCGIGPDGTVGCDITVPRNEDGSVVQWGTPGPPGFYSCTPPGQTQRQCPLPPPGTNQIVADPGKPARYVQSTALTFTRNLGVLAPGYRLVNGGASCYVSGASPGGINCKTGDNGFHWSSAGGTLE
ncbi:MAG: hypothetical protein WCP30_14830 [Mycobacteriaceae bacterium]